MWQNQNQSHGFYQGKAESGLSLGKCVSDYEPNQKVIIPFSKKVTSGSLHLIPKM